MRKVTMSTEQNKALIHDLADRINARDVDGAITLFSPHYVEHAVMPGMPAGAEAARMFFSMLFAGFPDVQTTILDMLAEGDKVVVRASTEGTHTGPFLGIPPTGRHAKWSFIDIHRIENGKIIEHWVETDQMSLMQQLGLVPPPQQNR
jgi:predicted ester cyclase